ncbi:MAG: amino acid ABC transporter permease [Desulfovibrionaceae bacterium]
MRTRAIRDALIRSGALWVPLLIVLLWWAQPAAAQQAGSPAELVGQAKQALNQGDMNAAAELFGSVPVPQSAETGGVYLYARMQLARMAWSDKDLDASEGYVRDVLAVFPDNIEAQTMLRSIEEARLPQWKKFLQDGKRFFPALLKGTVMTLVLVFFTMIVSPVGGLFIALGRLSRFKPLSSLCWMIIWIFRGTPLLLQLFFIYYGLPAVGITLDPLTAALFGLGLNYSAYLAEIIRAGIESIDDGQTEAAKALGMSYRQTMRRVIIPQTYKRIIPPFANEFIALIKDTALVSTIAMVELMRAADQMFNAYFNVTVLFFAALIYLAITSVFTLTFEWVERRVGVYERR